MYEFAVQLKYNVCNAHLDNLIEGLVQFMYEFIVHFKGYVWNAHLIHLIDCLFLYVNDNRVPRGTGMRCQQTAVQPLYEVITSSFTTGLQNYINL